MRNLILKLTLLSFLIFPGAALADGYKSGGYVGPSDSKTVTVAAAKKMRDDTHVVMVGKLTRQLGGERYEFTDSTGSIIVEIDDDDWRGLTVGPEDTVRIWGEVDRDFKKLEIDVDRIVKM